MTQPAEKCCECGSPDVRYHNYREQPFCWPCADGRGPNAQTPEQPARHTVDSITSDALDQLYAERDRWEQSARTLMEQRQELAAERYAWQERGDKAEATIERMKRTNRMVNRGARESRERAERAEAAIERVRAELVGIDRDAERLDRADESFRDAYVDAATRILAALDEHQEQQP